VLQVFRVLSAVAEERRCIPGAVLPGATSCTVRIEAG
jgi:hypothetical protein